MPYRFLDEIEEILEGAELRARQLRSRNDLICPDCFVLHDIEAELDATPSDIFRCARCGKEYHNDWHS